MKFVKTYAIEVEVDDAMIPVLVEDCGYDAESVIEEYGSIEEFVEEYVDEVICCSPYDEYFADVSVNSEVKQIA